eukprot:comp23038_c0_seq1/m.36845 comp23038_c0_seq1/g.36845  ORF comp23038_c0_seq1/g.36845 comp23038_c0_seq1/m.36845 type:complete len:354 (-) comp23038_c0_seq1:520-1581(-)
MSAKMTVTFKPVWVSFFGGVLVSILCFSLFGSFGPSLPCVQDAPTAFSTPTNSLSMQQPITDCSQCENTLAKQDGDVAGKRAFTTLMADTVTAWNTLCLAYFLHVRVKSKYPLVVMTLQDNLDERLEKALKGLNAVPLRIERFPVEPTGTQMWDNVRYSWRQSLHRLSMFNLRQYDRLAYLDSDMYVKYNADEMLDFGGPITVTYGTGGLNGGAMVFEPKAGLYDAMLRFARAHLTQSRVNDKIWRKSDQSFLIEFLKDWSGDKNGERFGHREAIGVPVASFIYNYAAIKCEELAAEPYNLVKIFHFTFTPNHTKPLEMDPAQVSPECFRPPVAAFHEAKREILKMFPDLASL